MSDFRIDQITNQAGTAGPQIAGITTFSSTSGLVMPSGPTEYRGGRGRGIFGGGATPGTVNSMEYITISTQSNSFDFGDLTRSVRDFGAVASSTRGVFGGGVTGPAVTNVIDFTVISSGGGAIDFGDLTYQARGQRGLSSSTRGLFFGGHDDTPAATRVYFNNINFITIASLGNASAFGELDQKLYRVAGLASPTRGVMSGGSTPSPTSVDINTIQYITIASTGNTQDFGDLTRIVSGGIGVSNTIRGVFAGGGTVNNTIEYVTIASLGDAIDFGDLTRSTFSLASASSSTRGVFAGGDGSPASFNVIDFITFASIGNATDFGDLISGLNQQLTGCSDAHGGLGD